MAEGFGDSASPASGLLPIAKVSRRRPDSIMISEDP